jgi:hypothetical protein
MIKLKVHKFTNPFETYKICDVKKFTFRIFVFNKRIANLFYHYLLSSYGIKLLRRVN